MNETRKIKFKTKATRFRELYPTIQKLLKDYTYFGVVSILKEKHDLDLTVNTFSNYLARYSDKTALPTGSRSAKITEEDKQTFVDNNEIPQDDDISPIEALERLKMKESKGLFD